MVYPETGSPTNMMLKKSASGVLASLRSSKRTEAYAFASSLAAALHGIRRVSTRQGWAGEKSGLFEHPVWCALVLLDVRTIEFPPCHNSFSAAC